MSKPTPLTEALSRALEANLRYTAAATRLASRALESAFSLTADIAPGLASIKQAVAQVANQTISAQQAVVPQAAVQKAAAPVIVLEGKAGETATGFFVVENSLPHEISTPVEVSTLIAPDGRQVQSALRFEPGVISLPAGEQVVARVTAKISSRLVPGQSYEGEILVPGVAGARIPIVLRRRLEVVPKKPKAKLSKDSPLPIAKKARKQASAAKTRKKPRHT